MAIIRIQDIAQHIGEQVTLQGWLYNKTDKEIGRASCRERV